MKIVKTPSPLHAFVSGSSVRRSGCCLAFFLLVLATWRDCVLVGNVLLHMLGFSVRCDVSVGIGQGGLATAKWHSVSCRLAVSGSS